jgi:hypothetical protein
MQDAETQFYKDHEEEMEVYNKWEETQKKNQEEDYATEEEEEKEEPAEPPKKPNFELEERKIAEDKFDEENDPVVIPPEVAEEFDNDWVMTEEEVTALVEAYWESKQ